MERVNAVGFAVLVDTATMFVNGEDPTMIAKLARRIGHVHVSEPNFAPIGTASVDHRAIATALAATTYEGWITVEMKTGNEWRMAIRRAHGLVSGLYRPGRAAGGRCWITAIEQRSPVTGP